MINLRELVCYKLKDAAQVGGKQLEIEFIFTEN